MKLLSSYFKEMKIAFRGFYFYVEIVIALIMLAILLLAVNPYPEIKTREFVYYDMSTVMLDAIIEKSVNEGGMQRADDMEFTLKPVEFTLTNQMTEETKTYTFNDKKSILVETWLVMDQDTGKVTQTIYRTESEEDMLRLSYANGNSGLTASMNEAGELIYHYMLQGYETDRFINLLNISNSASSTQIEAQIDTQVVREIGSGDRLNAREAVVPVFVAFAGSLMGFFIIMSYVFLDKDEGVIRAFAVTPSSVWKYLLSKIFVILTTVVLSSSIIAIPVMGIGPDYLSFYLFLLVTTYAFAALGLLIASFFNTIAKAFGVLYLIMIFLMLPAFSYYIPSFDPLWLRFFPTYPILQGFKEILLGNTDMSYILANSLAFLIGGSVIFYFANLRFKNTLTI